MWMALQGAIKIVQRFGSVYARYVEQEADRSVEHGEHDHDEDDDRKSGDDEDRDVVQAESDGDVSVICAIRSFTSVRTSGSTSVCDTASRM